MKQSKPALSFFHRFRDIVLDVLWPRFCSDCKALLPSKHESCFCQDCSKTVLSLQASAACPVCACPFRPLETSPLSRNLQPICLDCKRLRPSFAKTTARYLYGGAIKNAIHQLKWKGRDDLAHALGKELGVLFSDCANRCDIVITVPLHRRRLSERGYNQSVLLANAAKKESASLIPMYHDALIRKSFAKPMKDKNPIERILQVQNEFSVCPRFEQKIAGKKILLIDDVITTGATVASCSSVLLSKGATSVEVLALARAGFDDL